ncbi:TPA: hypothetical protein ACH3X2_009561 [Trebouxia sp. C0005]
MQADIHHITTVIIILGGCVDHPLSNINTSTENDDNSGDVMNVNVNEATGKPRTAKQLTQTDMRNFVYTSARKYDHQSVHSI